MSKIERLVFGTVKFRESEELEEFKFRFLAIIMLSGAVCTALFVLGEHSQVNPIAGWHVLSMTVFISLATVLWLLLRGHKKRFLPIAWTYEALCMLEYTSALIFVPQDELRVLWFLVNVPGVYILLGQRAGAAITVITVAGLALGNGHISAPYSSNAMATLLVSIIYLAVFFHFYADRSISFFVRMRDSNEKLRYTAMHDALTGLLNARAYYARCDHLIQLAQRNSTPYTVLFVDLDHFKQINDTHGHAAGDHVLKAVASALRENMRSSDLIGRIGGEEFSIFLPNTDQTAGLQVAESLRREIEKLMPDIGGQPLKITASLGVARNQYHDQSMQEIQRQADQAMYLAKSRGRNRVSCFEAVTGS